ncbi:hypothetical protein BDW66DRAFT_144548 [Aspergillus desertorum]
MADPLSFPAGIAGLLSLGIQVSEALYKFYASYKGQSTEIARTVDKLGTSPLYSSLSRMLSRAGLVTILQQLSTILLIVVPIL